MTGAIPQNVWMSQTTTYEGGVLKCAFTHTTTGPPSNFCAVNFNFCAFYAFR